MAWLGPLSVQTISILNNHTELDLNLLFGISSWVQIRTDDRFFNSSSQGHVCSMVEFALHERAEGAR